MKTLIVSDSKCDFVDVLESCGAETECIEFQKVLTVNLEDYDSFCILPEESGAYLEARFREKLEKEAGKGKKIFLQAIRGFQDILCGEPTDSTKSRMIYLEPLKKKSRDFVLDIFWMLKETGCVVRNFMRKKLNLFLSIRNTL